MEGLREKTYRRMREHEVVCGLPRAVVSSFSPFFDPSSDEVSVGASKCFEGRNSVVSDSEVLQSKDIYITITATLLQHAQIATRQLSSSPLHPRYCNMVQSWHHCIEIHLSREPQRRYMKFDFCSQHRKPSSPRPDERSEACFLRSSLALGLSEL